MIAGLILAAGRSRRMGRPKALLPYGETTFLGQIYRAAGDSMLGTVRVVLGHQPEPIIQALGFAPEVVVINRDYDLGMLSSLQAGIHAIAPLEPEAVVMLLVDHPRISADLIDSLIAAFRGGPGQIVIPAYNGRRGHPVLFGAAVFDDLLDAPLEEGARAVVRGHPELVSEISVDDPGILADIDTPEDYERLGRDHG